jgi:hypothetical protein
MVKKMIKEKLVFIFTYFAFIDFIGMPEPSSVD